MDLTRLLGADATPTPVAGVAPPVADARMQLIGVVSASSEEDAEEGLALIAMNGQPAKVYRVGMVVDGDTVLQSVEARGAKLGPLGGATLIALSATPLGTLAAPERQRSTATMAAAMPLPATPPSLPPPTPSPTPSADGTPPPFGGPPQASGGAPPAQPQGLPRRSGTRQPLRD
jgi:general secretion pathway protein C